jgi:hypothetical protein
VGSLKRFKDDVREVNSGFECGIGGHWRELHSILPFQIEFLELRQVAHSQNLSELINVPLILLRKHNRIIGRWAAKSRLRQPYPKTFSACPHPASIER